MNEIIQNIMDTVDKKGIQSNCKKILKKCSMKSAKDTGLITELAMCLKARILREQGDLNESKQIIEFVNQYRKPELYKNGVDWFLNTLDINIQSNLEENCKAGAKSWRLLKLELAIAYREAGKYPVSDDELEMIIKELKELLSKEK